MKLKSILLLFLVLHIAICLVSCSESDENEPTVTDRNFMMGFTTWSFGPNLEDVNDTYTFLDNHADIYAEHVDNLIPWNAWINDTELPSAFTNEITGRVNRKIPGKQLLLSVSLLNSNRDELASDFDGTLPSYTALDDDDIEDAYFKHINYLVGEFTPEYLVIAIEVNELRLRSPEKWNGYENLILEVRTRIKQLYPALKIAASVSLHNLFEPEVSNPATYIEEITRHMNEMDFVAISFYPFLKNQSSRAAFQETLDFLHANVTPPIAFVETSHIAENLIIPDLNVAIDGNENEQSDYLETLIENAENHNYEFIIWWAHRDYDALWETFPDDIKDLGQIWRDTGLLDENGSERPAFMVWSNHL